MESNVNILQSNAESIINEKKIAQQWLCLEEDVHQRSVTG